MFSQPARHVPFTRSDLPELGLTEATLKRALATGDVRRLLRGVFVFADVPDSPGLRIGAARRVVAPGHIAIDRTAAWLHGVDVLDHAGPAAVPIEICALRGRAATERSEVRGRNRDLAPTDLTTVDGLAVTTPLRTALDLGCILRRRDALGALDQFRRRFGISETDLRRGAVRYFRRRGVVQLRELIPLSDPRSESVRESWVRLALIDAGLPAPEPQYEIVDGGVPLFRLDHAYPQGATAVEYDGAEFHDSPEQREQDARRRRWLRDHGWYVVVVRRGDFTSPRLEQWLAVVRDRLTSPYTNLRW